MYTDNNFDRIIVHKGLIHNMSYEEPEYDDKYDEGEY